MILGAQGLTVYSIVVVLVLVLIQVLEVVAFDIAEQF